MKSQNNIFCVNFTGAFLYSGTVSLYFFPSLCRATRIKLHHSQGFAGLSHVTTHTAGCAPLYVTGDPVSRGAGRFLSFQETALFLGLKLSHLCPTEKEPCNGEWEVLSTEVTFESSWWHWYYIWCVFWDALIDLITYPIAYFKLIFT